MKQDITQTALWQEFLEWMGKSEYQITIAKTVDLIDELKPSGNYLGGAKLKRGALIGLLEQYIFESKGLLLVVASPYVGYGEEEGITKEKPLGYCGVIEQRRIITKPQLTPLEAKSEAIYQYFKSKG